MKAQLASNGKTTVAAIFRLFRDKLHQAKEDKHKKQINEKIKLLPGLVKKN